jgi:beta-lactam-binding protein with PASTA domain/predicted Ser/Thr protein kinase
MNDQPTGEVPRLRLGQRYELAKMVGRGGMAEVFEGYDQRLDRRVAVKILRTDLAADPTFHQRFRREAHSAASLNHPNIVAVYDTGEDMLDTPSGPTQVPFIVMEFVEGMSLRQLMSTGRRLLPERAMEITGGVLAALDYSHRHGIVHRDIKPGNVMITPSGDVKVMDFGIARLLSGEGQTMTATSAVMGTAQYLSPEQARGEVVDARSDLYSTGCLLYELLTGRPPFTGESPVAIAYQHVSEDPVPPSQLDPAVPESVDAVVMKSLAKNPDDRYQTAAEFKQDVERAIAGAPVTAMIPVGAAAGAAAATQVMAPTGATPAATPEKKGTSPWVWAGVAAAVLIVGGLAVALGSSLFGGSGGNVTVPDLRGQSVSEAQTSLSTVGLRLGSTTAEASDEESGTIIGQDPSSGEQLEQGQAVDVTVSAGAEEAVVPNLVGLQDQDDAARALEEVGLTLGTVTPRDSDQPEGFVLDQSPVQGATVETGSAVDIVTSSGFVTVPNVIGQTENAARSNLENAGLDVDTVTREDANATPGTVIDQAPAADSRAKKGDTVTITIAEAPPAPTPTPTPTPTDTGAAEPPAQEPAAEPPPSPANETGGGGAALPTPGTADNPEQ